MYRERIHLTVSDRAGWGEAVDVMKEMNTIMDRLAQPKATFWTETVGRFSRLTVEIDHVDLTAYEANHKAIYSDPDVQKQMQRLSAATIPSEGWTELLETVPVD